MAGHVEVWHGVLEGAHDELVGLSVVGPALGDLLELWLHAILPGGDSILSERSGSCQSVAQGVPFSRVTPR